LLKCADIAGRAVAGTRRAWRKRELVTDICCWFIVPVFAPGGVDGQSVPAEIGGQLAYPFRR
jgi:hypothetical protein